MTSKLHTLQEIASSLEYILAEVQLMLKNDDQLPEGSENVRKIAGILLRYHEGTMLLADLYNKIVIQNIGFKQY
jgi:hypothetical protein